MVRHACDIDRPRGSHTTCARWWILVLFIACIQVAIVDSSQSSSNGVAAFAPKGMDGGASTQLSTDEIDPADREERKTRKIKVKRKVKRRRRKVVRPSPAASGAIPGSVPPVPAVQEEEHAPTETKIVTPTHDSGTSTPALLFHGSRRKVTPSSTGSVATSDEPPASTQSNLAFIGDTSKDNPTNEEPKTIKQQPSKKKTKKDSSARTRTSSKGKAADDKRRSVGGGKEGECLRRIKREWKDAVALGIAYNWAKGETVVRKGKMSKAALTDPKYNYVRIGPMGRNLFRWHFSVQGAPNSVYEEGIYHGRVVLPVDYPASPPRVQMLTPSGRFEVETDICLSASSYHPESWTPRWTVLSLIDALRLHMLTNANEIGGVHATNEVRRARAKKSRTWSRGVVDHARMSAVGIFSLVSEDEEKTTDSGTSTVHEKKEHPEASRANAPSDEELLGMVTADVIRRHTERRARAVQPTSSISKVFLVVRVLFRSVISVLSSPVKLTLMVFMLIFAYLNAR